MNRKKYLRTPYNAIKTKRRKTSEQVFVRTLPFYSFTQNSFAPLKLNATEMFLAAADFLLFYSICTVRGSTDSMFVPLLGRQEFLSLLWENLLFLTSVGCIFIGLTTLFHKKISVSNTSSPNLKISLQLILIKTDCI